MFYMFKSSVKTTENDDEDTCWLTRKILVDITKSAFIFYWKSFYKDFFNGILDRWHF